MASKLRVLEAGDLLLITKQMRRLLAEYQDCAYALHANFDGLNDPNLVEEAKKTRHTLELSAGRIHALLTAIEKNSSFAGLREGYLSTRKRS